MDTIGKINNIQSRLNQHKFETMQNEGVQAIFDEIYPDNSNIVSPIISDDVTPRKKVPRGKIHNKSPHLQDTVKTFMH